MMKTTERINVVLPDAQLRLLRAQAKRERRSVSSLIRAAIEQYTGVRDTVEYGVPKPEDATPARN